MVACALVVWLIGDFVWLLCSYRYQVFFSSICSLVASPEPGSREMANFIALWEPGWKADLASRRPDSISCSGNQTKRVCIPLPGQPKNRQPIRPLLNIDWKMAFKSLGISILNTRACVGSMMSNVTRKDRESGTSSEDRVRPFFDSLLRGLWSDFLFQVARAVGSHHFICGLP